MPIDISQVELFVLIFIRISSAFAVMPVFSHSAAPTMVKAGLAGILALILVPTLGPQASVHGSTLIGFFVIGMREVVCGILLGLSGKLLFYSLEIAGQLIGFQAGFSVVSSIDPNTESESTLFTQFYNIAAMLIFLVMNGHHILLRSLIDSFHIVPLGKMAVDAGFANWSLSAVSRILADGVLLAAPVMVALLLTDAGLGILVRVAPMMNVFVVGFPIKVALTMLMVSLTLSGVMSVFTHRFEEYSLQLPAFLKLLAVP
jgi:flagellar biosynthesis protein FliR